MHKIYPRARTVEAVIRRRSFFTRFDVPHAMVRGAGGTVFSVRPSNMPMGGPYAVTVEHPAPEDGSLPYGPQETYYVNARGSRCDVGREAVPN